MALCREGRNVFTLMNKNECEEWREQSKIGWRELRTITACPVSRGSLFNRILHQTKQWSGYKCSPDNKQKQHDHFHLILNIYSKTANWYLSIKLVLIMIENILTFCYLIKVHDRLVKNNSPTILRKVDSLENRHNSPANWWKWVHFATSSSCLRAKEYFIDFYNCMLQLFKTVNRIKQYALGTGLSAFNVILTTRPSFSRSLVR